MTIVNKFNVNKQQVTLDADIIENLSVSANDVSYDDSIQYDENTVGGKLSELELEVIKQKGYISKDFIQTGGRKQLCVFNIYKGCTLSITGKLNEPATTNGYFEIYQRDAIIGKEEGRLLQKTIFKTGSSEGNIITYSPTDDYKDAKFVLYFNQNVEGNITISYANEQNLINAFKEINKNTFNIETLINNSLVIFSELFEMGNYNYKTKEYVVGIGKWWTSPYLCTKGFDAVHIVGDFPRYQIVTFNSEKQIISASSARLKGTDICICTKNVSYIRLAVSSNDDRLLTIEDIKSYNPSITKADIANMEVDNWVYGKPNNNGSIDTDNTWMTSKDMIYLNHNKFLFYAPADTEWEWRVMISYYDKYKKFIKRGNIKESAKNALNQFVSNDEIPENTYYIYYSVGRIPYREYVQSEEYSKTTRLYGIDKYNITPKMVQKNTEDIINTGVTTGVTAYFKGIHTTGEIIIKQNIVLEPNIPYKITCSISEYPTAHNAYLDLREMGGSFYKDFVFNFNAALRKYYISETFLVPSKIENIRLRLLSTDTLGEVVIGLYKLDSLTVGDINGRLSDIESTIGEGILKYTDIYEVENILNNIKRPSESYNGTDGDIKHLNLCWFSDIHHSEDNLVRIMNFYKIYSDSFNDMLFTGDAVMAVTSDDFSFWTKYDFAKNILFTLGNHEVYIRVGDNWELNPDKKAVFDKFMYGRSNWNVTFADNAESLGLSYYYKDYVDAKIRMIVLDCMYWDDAQNIWLAETLENARTLGYSVICVSHFAPSQLKMNENTAWTDSYFIRNSTHKTVDLSSSSTTFGTDGKAAATVEQFIENGGSFVTWLCGHLHADVFGTLISHPNQTVVGITSAMTDIRFQSGARLTGTISQDAINIISFDALQKTFSVYRIGSNMDCLLRKKEILVYSWDKSNMRILRD